MVKADHTVVICYSSYQLCDDNQKLHFREKKKIGSGIRLIVQV